MAMLEGAAGKEILSRCLCGDAGAQNDFVDACAPIVYGAVRRLLRGHQTGDPSIGPEDITQDVFVRLFRDDARLLRTYDPARASLATWLTLVSRSTALDFLRRKKPDTVPLGPETSSPAAKPQAPLDAGIIIPHNLLSPRQRVVLTLLYDHCMQVREAARLLRIEEQTVRSLRHKALEKLRRFFGRAGGPAGNLASRGDVRGRADV